MSNTKNNRNFSLDMLKLLLSFLIVIHHTPSPFHDFVTPLTTCAVPIFFMVSGYLVFGREITIDRTKKNAKRILMIFCWSLVLFFFWYLIRHGVIYKPNYKDILLFVLANNEPLSGHLWYLMAYVYALLFILILVSIDKIRWLFYIAPILIGLYFVADGWHIYYDVPRYLTLVYCFRNFAFTAIPMMCIGAFFRIQKIKYSRQYLLLGVIVLAALAILEMNIFHVNHIADVYFLTIPLSITIFLLFCNIKVSTPNCIATCGEKYSLYIYILHPIVIKILIDKWGVSYLTGVIVFVITLFISILYVTIKNTVIKIKNKS